MCNFLFPSDNHACFIIESYFGFGFNDLSVLTGTHGHMKCVFNGQLKSQDTVLMNLYKRMYCKWTYNPRVPCPPAPSNMEEEEEGQAFHIFD